MGLIICGSKNQPCQSPENFPKYIDVYSLYDNDIPQLCGQDSWNVFIHTYKTSQFLRTIFWAKGSSNVPFVYSRKHPSLIDFCEFVFLKQEPWIVPVPWTIFGKSVRSCGTVVSSICCDQVCYHGNYTSRWLPSRSVQSVFAGASTNTVV